MSENISIKTIYDANNDKENTLTFNGSVSRLGNTITGVDTDTNTTYINGTGIAISNNVISCTVVNTNTTYTGWDGITLTGTSFSCSTNYAAPTGNPDNDFKANIMSIASFIKIDGWYIGEVENIGLRDSVEENDLVFSRSRNLSGKPNDASYVWMSSTDTDSDKINFTGQHNLVTEDTIIKKNIGYIVSSVGKYKDINSKYKNNILNIKINQLLPYCILSTTMNDKRCIWCCFRYRR